MDKSSLTFANFPYCDNLEKLDAQIAILGIPYGTTYDPDSRVHSRDAPMIIRQESLRYPDDPIAWDFDLSGPLIRDVPLRIVDCGDVPGEIHDSSGNRQAAQKAVQQLLKAEVIPVILGGDDSIPIPVLRAYENENPFVLMQIDAHIDWRDEVNGVRDGYSSTMRRASEMPWVAKIVQVGMRGVGSARREEFEAAKAYGAKIITSYELVESGLGAVLAQIPPGTRCFLTIDFDALDPSEMHAVGGPTPGGITFMELIKLIHAVSNRTEIIGVCLVEFVPQKDLNNLGAITAMRVVWNVIGALLRK